MPMDPPPPAAAPLVDPDELSELEAEADRVFGPLAGDIPADVMELMRDVFVIAAATHPDAVRLREALRKDGVKLQTAKQAKEPESAAPPKRKAGGRLP